MLFGLIATVMLSVSGNANELKNSIKQNSETSLFENLRIKISIHIEWGRKSRNCAGFGICSTDISVETELNEITAINEGNGLFKIEFNDTQLSSIKKHFNSIDKITISEDYILPDEVCNKLELKTGYVIKKGEYSIKTIEKGYYSVSF